MLQVWSHYCHLRHQCEKGREWERERDWKRHGAYRHVVQGGRGSQAGKMHVALGQLLLQTRTPAHMHTAAQTAAGVAVLSRHKWRPRPPAATRARDGLWIDFQYASSSLSKTEARLILPLSPPPPPLSFPSPNRLPSLHSCSLTNSSLSSSHAGSRPPPPPFAPPSSLFSLPHPSEKPTPPWAPISWCSPFPSNPNPPSSPTVFFFSHIYFRKRPAVESQPPSRSRLNLSALSTCTAAALCD